MATKKNLVKTMFVNILTAVVIVFVLSLSMATSIYAFNNSINQKSEPYSVSDDLRDAAKDIVQLRGPFYHGQISD